MATLKAQSLISLQNTKPSFRTLNFFTLPISICFLLDLEVLWA